MNHKRRSIIADKLILFIFFQGNHFRDICRFGSTIFFYLQIWQVTGMRTFRVIKAVLSIGRIEMFTSRFKIGWIAYPFFVDMKPVLSRRQVPTFKVDPYAFGLLHQYASSYFITFRIMQGDFNFFRFLYRLARRFDAWLFTTFLFSLRVIGLACTHQNDDTQP